MDSGNNPVVLLFAGGATRTFANKIDRVLSRFNVSIDVSSGPVNNPPNVSISSPADGATFSSGATISFSGTASDTEDDDVTVSLVWVSDIIGQIGTGGSFSTALADGVHAITATATDSGGKSGGASVSITVGEVVNPTAVSVASISYATEGGKNGDKHLNVTVAIEDNAGAAVSGATVSVTLRNDSGSSWNGTATTGASGTVTFTLKNARSGCYTNEVTSVTAAGLTWDGDGTSAAPGFCKP